MTRRNLSRVFAFLIIMGLAFSLAFAGGKYRLAYKMKKGQNLKYKSTSKIEQTQERMGREIETSINAENVIDIVVENVGDDHNITLIYKLDSMRAAVKNPMFDSTFVNPPEIIGKRMRQIITAAGKRLKSEQVDSIRLTGLLAQTGGGQQLSLRLPKLPKDEVTIGSKWTTNDPDSQSTGGMKTLITPSTTFEVQAEVDTLGYKCLRIKYSGQVKLKGQGEQRGMKLFLEGDGPTEGTLYFAPEEGLLVAMIATTEMDMTIALTGQVNMTIPSSTNSEVKLVLVK